MEELAGARKALREQSLAALRELFSAFLRADEGGQLREHATELKGVLVRLVLRMVVMLFAEARGLLPAPRGESLFDILARLEADAGQEGAAFASLRGAFENVLSRLRVLDDACAEPGGLFSPAWPPFLATGSRLVASVPDPVVLRVFQKLVFPAGDRLSYASLDVELVGSVYEGLMGFDVEVSHGESVALVPDDVVVCLDDLLALPEDERVSRLREVAGLHLRGHAASAVQTARTTAELLSALASRVSPRQPSPIPAGALFFQPIEDRRRLGAHYTSRELTQVMVERTLAPLVPPEAAPETILSLRVCDPAMGSGAFLVEVCRWLAERLVLAKGETVEIHALRRVASSCVWGVDKNPLAADLARASLWLLACADGHPASFAAEHLRHGDSLVGAGWDEVAAVAPGLGRDRKDEARIIADLVVGAELASKDKPSLQRAKDALSSAIAAWLGGAGEPLLLVAQAATVRREHHPFHWEIELEDVFSRGGFDAFVGNPPWVSYAGRAAQPLAAELRRYFQMNPAFAGYRNLQGLFVYRAARMLRPSGRLGFVLPTSMSDLDGYEPSRRAHDVLAICDDELPDFGDAFDGVFQPSMGLLSTRRELPVEVAEAGVWPLSRSDIDGPAKALLERLAALPVLPAQLFGERGFQTTGDDVVKLHERASPEGRLSASVRVGGDIEPFSRRPPRLFCDPADFDGRFRAEDAWKTIRLFIRQTARFPMAALSDGGAFRNSILAGFSDETFSAFFLCAWLNASPIRWYHYMRHRDARQGMPQVKIAHLRAIPAPPHREAMAEIEALGRRLGTENRGITAAEQEALDAHVARALGMNDEERGLVAAWASRHTARKAEPASTSKPFVDA